MDILAKKKSGLELTPQVVFAGLVDFDGDDVTGFEVMRVVVNEEVAIDFGGVGHCATGCNAVLINVVDDDLQSSSDFGREFGGGDALRLLHEAVPAILFDFFGHVTRQRV